MKINLSYLKEMTGGNQALMQEMIDIFKNQVKEFSRDMDEYLNKEDYVSLGMLAHKAKSSISIMGLDDLSNDMKVLENLAKSGKEPEKYPLLVDKFKKETKEAVEELDEVLQNLELFL
jgi:HPt (histidine-containing phosphotransfer) domain-containing protein